jgi:hypothetical protein
MVDYITNKDTIIFSPYYNETIAKGLLEKYNNVIFSDYELNEDLFDAYENLDFKGLKLIYSGFNKKVELPPNLTHLTFGWYFDIKVELPSNLTHLTFGDEFTQKVELPPNLTHLTFGWNFNQKVELPENLTHLTFGDCFNQKVDLPLNLKYLKLENDKAHNLDYLPEGIEELVLGYSFNDNTLCNLPNSLKVIKLSKEYNGNLKCLPSNTKIECYK